MTISQLRAEDEPKADGGDPTHLQIAYFRQVESGTTTTPTLTTRSQRIFRQHCELAEFRHAGTAAIRVHRCGDETGIGAAVQIVTDDMPLLVTSIVSTLQRIGASVTEVIHPIFDVTRDEDGRLQTVAPRDSENNGRESAPHESWIHVQLDNATDDNVLTRIATTAPTLLAELRRIAEDTPAILRVQTEVADQLDTTANQLAQREDPAESECADLLRWLADGHFTMLGYARYDLDPANEAAPRHVAGTGLGVLREDATTEIAIPPLATERPRLRLVEGWADTVVPGGFDPYFVGIAEYDQAGRVAGEHLFVGAFTVAALHENILDIPVIEHRVQRVIEWTGFDPNSFSGKAMLEVLQSLPRVELFSSNARTLFDTTSAVLNLGLRSQIRLFLRQDPRSRIVSCLVYLPRDRYTTAVRLRMQDILLAEFNGEYIGYSARATESELANVYFTVHRPAQASPADTSEANRQRIQQLLFETSRTWVDRLVAEAAADPAVDSAVVQEYADAFPDGYKQDFAPRHALDDVTRLEQLADGAVETHLYREPSAPVGHWRLTLYVGGEGVSLSRVLPVLRSLGVDVMDERPYPIVLRDGWQCWIYNFGLRAAPELLRTALDPDIDAALVETSIPAAKPTRVQESFPETFEAMWYGRAETDSLNELVLRAGLHWREVSVLRAYSKYLRQAGFAYSQSNIARVLLAHPDAARLFVDLFEASFDPDRTDPERVAEIETALRDRIDAVVGLDADRILRAILGLITATLRTNYYMVGAQAPQSTGRRSHLSLKFDPSRITELPKPKPQFEIFVYSPRVEGVHLRFGAVARGGLRWSDRREDFRTEILGLVKAQAVKNAVIVPVGAKGGFVVKNPPAPTGDPAADREATLAEGIACYRLFISGLLDLTDTIDKGTGAVQPPDRVVRRDGDDTYLVVAADKGTATFSDIANEVAARYTFWLGDAFASGGSMGYDHKAMGITAKGAWESVKRHFLELGVDTQSQDFTVVGIGDMSGDVFGNGMLLSEHIRLVAAFDHRHIFIDPNPDAAQSFIERKRLFGLPRSSWADYDAALISKGGGVWDRAAKAIPVSPEMRGALGLPEGTVALSPPEMVRAMLLAPVDLLWNGGIGTYIKSAAESNSDVGDKSNDAVRVDGNQLRVTVIGEGGNLGATPLGRIEFALAGGKVNTDALDNSAGVDCSDHEVNIKVLLDRLVSAGALDAAQRDPLLASMTDEVAELVLRDNISQNFLMGLSRWDAAGMLSVHRRLITTLEDRHGLDRELEALPSDAETKRRMAEGRGLTSPELATLMAHVKLAVKSDLLGGTLPDDAAFARRLPNYFPKPLRNRFGQAIEAHPLRRQIVATTLANDMVDLGGITYAFRQSEEAGADTSDAVRAFTAAVQIFDLRELWQRIRTTQISTAVRDDLEMETKRTLDRASRWLLVNRPQPIAIGAEINRYAVEVRELMPVVSNWLCEDHLQDISDRALPLIEQGAPEELANEVCRLIHLFPLLDVLDITVTTERDRHEVATLYFALDNHLQIQRLLRAVRRLERSDRWHSLARLAVFDDMYSALRALTVAVLSATEPDETAAEKIEYWESTHQSRLARARAVLAEIRKAGVEDLAALSVAARQIRSMSNGMNEVSVRR